MENNSPTGHGKRAATRGLLSWALWDWANSPFATLIQTFVFAAYFTRRVAEDETTGTAQWGTMTSLAGLAIALGGPLLGAIADQTGRRKRWIGWFTLVCAVASALLWFVKPQNDHVWLALILVGLGTLAVEYATIFYNSMLGSLAAPERIGRWSGWGWALGYGGGLACLLIALLAFVRPESPPFGLDKQSAEHVRATFLLVAVWFILFSVPLFLFTPDTPASGKRFRDAARDGWRQLVESIKHVRQYKHIVMFLIARMVYVDGLATMFAFGGVFAAGTFNMNEEQVIWFGIALNVTAGIGAFGLGWLDDIVGSKKTIILSLIGLIIPGTVMLAAPTQTWFWVGGLVLGLFVGPVQAASRSYLSRAAPDHLRNQFFGLYAFSGKATSFLGPLLVGWITHWSGTQRIGMTAVIALFVIGLVLMLFVPRARATGRD